MKHIVIGDIHGDEGVIYYALNSFPHNRLLFVGDFLDSFVFNSKECVGALKLVLDLIEEDRADSLIGNHELSYLASRWRCSGYNDVTQNYLTLETWRMMKLLKPFIYNKEHRVLFTHAGLSRSLWTQHNLDFENLEDRLHQAYGDHNSFFYQIGRRRGGFASCGGPLWCDWAEFEPIEGLRQVFGHSAGLIGSPEGAKSEGRIRSVGENYNIDCLQFGRDFLEFDDVTGEIKPMLTTLVVEYKVNEKWHPWNLDGVPRDMAQAMRIAKNIQTALKMRSRIRDTATGNVIPGEFLA